MMKRHLQLLSILLVLSLILIACSDKSENTAGSKSNDNDEETFKFQIGLNNPEGSPEELGAQKFKELIEEKTKGQIKVEVFPNAALGGEREMLEGMKIGSPEMVVTGDAVFGMFTPEYTALSLPFLVEDTDHLDAIFNGEIGEEINQAFQESLGASLKSVWHRGARNLTANKEVKTPDDLEHMKLRVPETPLSIESWKALGANPTPMSFDELFVALEQKTAEGQENPLELIYNAHFYEVQSHTMLTEHLIGPFMVLMNDEKFASMPEELQDQFNETMDETKIYVDDIVSKSGEEYTELLLEEDMEIIEVDRDAFRKAIEEAGLIEKFEDEWASNLVERIRDAK